MTNIQNLFDEITSLEIKISGVENVYSLEHYNQAENEHENRLKKLNEGALTDILNLTDEQIKRQIIRLEAEHNKLKKLKVYFGEQYKLFFHGTGFDADEFMYFLGRYLIITFPERKLNNVITKEFMFCLSDAITFKAMYLIGFINRVKEQTTTSEPQAITPPPAETPADKIRTILEPLKGAFADPKHIDLIIEAMQTGAEPEGYLCQHLQFENKDFYPTIKEMKKEIDLTYIVIAKILNRFIYANNGSSNALSWKTINTNIKRKYPKDI